MNITILCVGKIKEAYFRDGISEYLKRLSAYAKVRIVEVEDEKTKENASEHENELVKIKEGKKLLSKIPERSRVIALAIEGESFDSIELSRKIGRYQVKGISDLTLIIGGSLGLSQEVLDACQEKWSFGKLTFPHQMMRMILLEQIYRAYRIMNGEPYHK